MTEILSQRKRRRPAPRRRAGRHGSARGTSSRRLEAGVGRDSFYRSPPEFKNRFQAARENHTDNQPEIVRLRGELAKLKREHAEARRRQAEAIRDLEETNKTYANHIQVLTLANAELAAENKRLRAHINPREGNVMRLPQR